VKDMKKSIMFLLIVGVLMLGTIAITEAICENAFQNIDFSDGGDFEPQGEGGSTTNGGGGSGSHPAPG
jgi:hypothetical protein